MLVTKNGEINRVLVKHSPMDSGGNASQSNAAGTLTYSFNPGGGGA